ncbi:RNA polymerase sigma factor [Corallincola luteus]|uniref:RNA polymerase sigma factor n=1 Tax=Corallincola luteus TaxID=1775177 RepID=UPI001F117BF9|nr:sigma-70 family RNA polymerase sigma factor [Corallincola luteus]
MASLARKFGIQHLETIEDAVQTAMFKALTHWPGNQPPDTPAAWLYKVALREILSELRADQRHHHLLHQEQTARDEPTSEHLDVSFSSELADSLLRMLFLACDKNIPVASQLVFTLKSLCGFSVPEIATRLFITEANVYKRLTRAKKYLKSQPRLLNELSDSQVNERIATVHNVLYLMFTEGYLSSHPDTAIRKDLCEEATRLTLVLSQNKLGNVPATLALLALMHFNLARLDSRRDDSGLVLLADQDRCKWNQSQIVQGLVYLEQSASGDAISRFHIEAGIAAEHCLAKNYDSTNWEKIAAAYKLLETFAPSPMHLLNRALATAQYKNPADGLQIIKQANIPTWLSCSYHWYAVIADLQYRANELDSAEKNAEQAIALAPTDEIKKLLKQRMNTHRVVNLIE